MSVAYFPIEASINSETRRERLAAAERRVMMTLTVYIAHNCLLRFHEFNRRHVRRRVALFICFAGIMGFVKPIIFSEYNGELQTSMFNSNVLRTDDVITDELVLETIGLSEMESAASKSYAVFSATADRSQVSLNFLFLLPLTVLAWKNIGFGSIVILVGPSELWHLDKVVKLVVSRVRELGAVVILVEPRQENSILTSQVSRLFVANIIRARSSHPSAVDDVYLVTTDADVWPINGSAYRLPVGADVLSLNAFCCGTFEHNGSSYRMLPMSNIGMKIGTWHEVTHRYGHSPETVDDMMSLIGREFGSYAREPVKKGENIAWYTDQRLISVLLADSNRVTTQGIPRFNISYVRRDTLTDRFDRARWKSLRTNAMTLAIKRGVKVDAHLPNDGYKPEVWVQIRPLVDALHRLRDEQGHLNLKWISWSTTFVDDFRRLSSRVTAVRTSRGRAVNVRKSISKHALVDIHS